MYCTKCGTMLPTGATQCGACGQVVIRFPAEQPFANSIKILSEQEAQPAPPQPERYDHPPPPSPGHMPPAPPYGYPPQGYVPYAYGPPQPSPYPDFGTRLVAHLIDALIVMSCTVALGIAIAAILGMTYVKQSLGDLEKPDSTLPCALAIGFVLWWLATVVGSWLYAALQESGPNQATVGKRMLGIIVTNTKGRHLTFAHASGRHFAKIVSGLVPLAFGFIMAAFTERRQALHDMIAGTLVIKKDGPS